jgi:hypothetical protein
MVLAGFRTDSDRDSVTAVLTKPNTIPQPNGLPPVVIKVPQSIHEIDSAHTVGFGAELAEDHPVSAGWSAAVIKQQQQQQQQEEGASGATSGSSCRSSNQPAATQA